MAKVLMAVYNTIQTDARVIRAATALHSSGYDVCVLSCNSDVDYRNEHFASVVYTSPKRGGRLLIAFWLFVLKYALKHRDFDILYMHDYFMPYVGKLIHSIVHKPWVYDAHELLLQRKTHRYSLREKFFLCLEAHSIRNAALVIAANDERLRIINRVYSLNNAISVGNIAPMIRVAGGVIPKKEQILVYQGTLSEERKVSEYIKVLSLLDPKVKLKLIGGSSDINTYRLLAKEYGVEDRVIFTGKIPYSQLINESQECTLGFVTYRMDGLNTYYCSPNKIFEYVQLGLPVICSPQPFLVRLCREYNIGEVWDIEKADLHELATAINKVLSNIDSYTEKMADFNCDFNCESEMNKLVTAVKRIKL